MRSTLTPRRGVALIAVLWLVAAMALITSGVVHSVRGEIRSVGTGKSTLVATAQADAAILIYLQGIQSQPQRQLVALEDKVVNFQGVEIRVVARALNGFIDINSAPVNLLADLYRYVGGLDARSAELLAQATVDTRQVRSKSGQKVAFEAVEELLRVPKIDYALYAKLHSLVTAEVVNGSGKVNPLAAPTGVLMILAGGSAPRAMELAARRDAAPNLMDTTFFQPAHIETSVSRSMRLQTFVDLKDGRLVERSWDVYLGDDSRTGLPWRVIGTSNPTIQQAAANG